MKLNWKTGIVCTFLAVLVSCSNAFVQDSDKASTIATKAAPSRQINVSTNQMLVARSGYRIDELVYVHNAVTIEYFIPAALSGKKVRIVDSSTGEQYLSPRTYSGTVDLSFTTDRTVRLSYQYLWRVSGFNEYWDEIDYITLENRTYNDVALLVYEGGRLLGPSATVAPDDVLTLGSNIYGNEVSSVGWRINNGNEIRLAKGDSTTYTIPAAYNGFLTITFTAYYPDNEPIFNKYLLLSVPEIRPDGGYNLYQLYHHKKFFLTTNQAELITALQAGYVIHELVGGVYPKQDSKPGLKPLLRYINTSRTQHFFTTSPAEVLYLNQIGWYFEGITGYIFRDATEGAQPLYRFNMNGMFYYTSNPVIVSTYKNYPKQLLGYVYP